MNQTNHSFRALLLISKLYKAKQLTDQERDIIKERLFLEESKLIAILNTLSDDEDKLTQEILNYAYEYTTASKTPEKETALIK